MTLLRALSDPRAYPFDVQSVELRQTHVSAVFLVDGLAYKTKKPKTFGFLDFSSLEKRRRACDDEVRLNRRLAPHVYLGVVPIVEAGTGVEVEGAGEPVEWAVKMVRLPEEATLRARLAADTVSVDDLERVAARLASFHAQADRSETISRFAGFDVVAKNARDNFAQTSEHIGSTVSVRVHSRLRDLTEAALARLETRITARATRGVPCEAHGDLRLDHVYLFPDRPPPEDVVVIDCIEFSEALRCSDPIADVAFLAMELSVMGRRDLANAFAKAYLREAKDEEGLALLGFYIAYRSAVRAKVRGLEALDSEIDQKAREAAIARSRAHWLFALGELESPKERPCVVLVCGLPGTGKSTVASDLGRKASFEVIRSDVVRKALAGLAPMDSARAPYGEGLYSPERTEGTYARCLELTEATLFEGHRALIDATFASEGHREAFVDLAARSGVPIVILHCDLPSGDAEARILARSGDASDADVAVRRAAVAAWEPFGERTRAHVRTVSTTDSMERARAAALEALRSEGFA